MHVALEEFRSAYVAEADEHIAGVHGLLLALERGIAEGKSLPKELRELMRLLHTIKGLSAMVGVEPVVMLAHRMETIVRAGDRAGGRLESRSIDALVNGARAIEARIKAVAENRAVPDVPKALLAELDALELPAAPTTTPETLPLDPAIAERLNASEQNELREGVKGGRRALRLSFVPGPEKIARGITITSVREKLSLLGSIVKVLPLTKPVSEAAPGGLVFAILLLSDASLESVAETAGGTTDDVVVLLERASPPPAPPERGVELAVDPDEGDVPRANILRVEITRVDLALERLSSLIVTRSRLVRAAESMALAGADTRELKAILSDHARQLRDLRGAILGLRMVPLATVLDRIPLLVRGLKKTMQKRLRVELDAGGAEVDKTVAERLFPALLHLVRNAVDHGVEPPEERLAVGKREEACITIRCAARNRQVELTVADDGRGIDRERLGATDDRALLDLLCRPGFSTRRTVDTTSGRGMGMDIARKAVEGLGGELELETTLGVGTMWTIRVPLTIAIVDAFTVSCSGERFVVPVPLVEEVIELSPDKIVSAPKGRLFARRGETLPIVELASALALARPTKTSPETATSVALVVRRGRDEPVAFAIDRVLTQQETVVRPLLDPLVAVAGIAGATDLGDGRATLVLDLVSLIATLENAA